MFKKAVEAKPQQRLSGADRKKLRRTVKDRFPNASDAHLDTLLPPKVEITVSKYPNRILVYGLEGGDPLFFDSDGRGTYIYPTVYALWKVPELLPSFVLKGGEVSRFVIGGADLMFPGIKIPADGLPSFSTGEPWAVKVPGNPAPIAVGSTTVSGTEALKANLRGKALRITHSYRDALWESSETPHVPNAGFLEDVVFEDPALFSACKASDPCEGDIASDQGTAVRNEEFAGLDYLKDDQSARNPASTDVFDVKDEENETLSKETGDLKVSDTLDESNVEDYHMLSVEEVDALLDKCLLQALHTSVKEKDFPLPGSTLWSTHVLPCRPSGVTLDIKKSSYKKLSKWLQSKASTGLISVKEDKHKKEVMLFSVNRSHPDYESFKPEKSKTDKSPQPNETPVGEGQSDKIFEVVEVFKPSTHVNCIFASVGADTASLFTASEASQIVFQYVEKENLVKPTDRSMVILDATLCDALFKGAIKKGSSYPTEVHKKDIGSIFISRMQAHHRVTRGGETVVRKGALKTIHLMTERRQGNKKVTKASGLESFLLDPQALASELQKKFACSTTVSELPGKKGYEVLIQGGVIDDVAKHLIEQYSIPKRFIEVLDKTKK